MPQIFEMPIMKIIQNLWTMIVQTDVKLRFNAFINVLPVTIRLKVILECM